MAFGDNGKDAFYFVVVIVVVVVVFLIVTITGLELGVQEGR